MIYSAKQNKSLRSLIDYSEEKTLTIMKVIQKRNGLEQLLYRTGEWYPLFVLLVVQTVNTFLVILLTALPAQQNAQFDPSQGLGLLTFGSAAYLFRNIFLLIRFKLKNEDIFTRLSHLRKHGKVDDDREVEKRAWEQATKASKQYIKVEGCGVVGLVFIPTLAYGYFVLQISGLQILYLLPAAIAANSVNVIMEVLTLDLLFAPMVKTLLPRRVEDQLSGFNGVNLPTKLSIGILGIVAISLLLIIPTAYRQISYVVDIVDPTSEQVRQALLLIINAGFGAVFVGGLLAGRLVHYLSNPFDKMIELFKSVKKGDLNRRFEVVNTDEFGEVSIYMNDMLSQLQGMTDSLEKQVTERTKQLQQANQILQLELSERKRTQERLTYIALHDPLTDLPNRKLLIDHLGQVVKNAHQRGEYRYAVFFLDLDRFKVVNDSLGHNIGDLLLVESAQRLKECVRGNDVIARLGGDEFVVLLEDLDESIDFTDFADRIQYKLGMPGELGPYRVFISVSIGIVLGDARYDNPEDILRDADIAMYRAKNHGRGCYEVFSPVMLNEAISRLDLENDLRQGLNKNEFILKYQPIVEFKNAQIIGFEALVRWQHPSRGLIPPAEFIPLAEETGLIIPLGYWIMDEACRQLHEWQEEYKTDPPISININLSTRQCVDIDLIEKIKQVLNKYQLDAGCLNLELSESLIVKDTKYISSVLTNLRELGVRVQIDDFGTGYSSLGYLNKLPIDMLKIDRTFINQLGCSRSGFEIVQSILALAHSLDLKVIAEGVETHDQLKKLRLLGCEYVQGFLFGQPINSDGVGEILETYPATAMERIRDWTSLTQ